MALKNKIFILFILIFIIGTGSVFGATAPMLTDEISENIIDYFSNHCDGFYTNTSRVMTLTNLESCKTMLQNFDSTKLTTYWNENINNILTNYSDTSSMNFDFTNIAVYGQITNLNDYDLIFTFSNNSSPGDNLLSFAQITQQSTYNHTFEVYNENSHAYILTIRILNGDIDINSSRSIKNMRNTENFYYYYPENLNIRIDNVSMYMYNQLALTNTQEIYFRSMNDSSLDNYYIIGNVYNTIIPPDIPGSGDTESGDNSGDTGGGSTTPSGDTGGGTTYPDYSEKLDNIQGSIDNVNQNLDIISGELNEINNNLTTVPELSGETISSGDIIGALGFEFAEDPYSNFWLELTTGLGNAFTDEVRSINVQFRENTHEINLDNFSIQLPGVLKVFLTTISTVFICWKMLKYWKIIIDNITSGNMDEVLSMNEEERYY